MTREHIVQIGVCVDDDAIAKGVQESAEKEVIKMICEKVERVICGKYGYSYSRVNKDDLTPLRYIVERKVDEIISANKKYILDNASKILAERLARSKAGKAILENLEGKTNVG